MAHGELTHGMVLGGHILLGNHEIIHADRLTPITSLYPIQAHCTGGLDLIVEPRPEQPLRYQWNMASLGAHKRQNHPPPCGTVASDQVTIRRHASQGQA